MANDTRSGLRVLVIEDQHDIAANIWDFLERRGHVVDHCADGISGLARAISGGFDVIVLDLGLPRLDGLDLCRQLRAEGHGVPVLMLTARDTLDDKLRGFAEGAQADHASAALQGVEYAPDRPQTPPRRAPACSVPTNRRRQGRR